MMKRTSFYLFIFWGVLILKGLVVLHSLKLTPKKDVIFITGDWNAKVGSQEIPGVTGKFGPGV